MNFAWLGKLFGSKAVPAPINEPPMPQPTFPPKPSSFKNFIFEGSTYPYDPFKIVKVNLNDTIKNEYLPALQFALPNAPKGLKLLMTAMTHQEGFRKGTRSYRYNNPANLGNTDSGANKGFPSLVEGIIAQAEHLKAIAEGKKKAYPLGKELHIAPYYSPEIAANPQYGLPAHLPGYNFTYTGELQQFLKIYSTGARATIEPTTLSKVEALLNIRCISVPNTEKHIHASRVIPPRHINAILSDFASFSPAEPGLYFVAIIFILKLKDILLLLL